MTFRITHRTTYTYDDRVSPSYGQLYMIPGDSAGQSCRSAVIRIEPRPDFYRERLDFFGPAQLRPGILQARASGA